MTSAPSKASSKVSRISLRSSSSVTSGPARGAARFRRPTSSSKVEANTELGRRMA